MKIALIGNQNSGKTTLFNRLTGMKQKVGNWPGVTVEKKIGTIIGTNHQIIDLPGIYSFSPYTIEEKISQDFVLNENIDLIINVVDASNLERSLYLTTQILELDCKVIIVLNMIDVVNKKGIIIDDAKLEEQLGTIVCRVSAKNGTGINMLISLIANAKSPNNKIFDDYIEEKITSIENKLLQHQRNKRFIALKLLEGKNNIKGVDVSNYIEEIQKRYNLEISEIIAMKRYEYLDELILKTIIYKKKYKISSSNILDKLFLNKYLCFPIFVLVMFFVYYFSVGIVGNYITPIVSNILEEINNITQTVLNKIEVSEWVCSLVMDGVMSGVGTVLGFVPQLLILFLSISILEASGYMSRVSLMFDSLFRRIGLSGKSLIPFIVGSGCSVPGIMASRIIEKEQERELTIMLTPYIPCSAKLPIIALFSGYFFGEHAGIVSALFYFFAIIIIVASAYVMNIGKVASVPYIAELPEYKLPNLAYTLRDVLDKVNSFFKRAGSTILLCSIAIWFLLSFSTKFQYGVNVEDSILATFGKKISWIFYPMLGVNSWEATVSILQGVVAKEQVVSSMSVISGFTGNANNIFEGGVFNFFTLASACAFVSFNLFSVPCINAIITMKKELRSTAKLIKVLLFQTFTAYIISVIIYQFGSRL